MPTHLSEIFNKSLSEQVLDVLRESILNGELRPGTALVETELAARLGVSRAPLREALRLLSAEGLVEAVPYHGAKVRTLTRADVEELYSLRAALEIFAVQQVMRQDTSQAVERLRACDDALSAAGQSGDWSRVDEADCAFHRTLIVLSGHSLLLATWDSLSLRVRQVTALLGYANRDAAEIAQRHAEIIDAIARGDEAQVTTTLQNDSAASRNRVAALWSDTETAAD